MSMPFYLASSNSLKIQELSSLLPGVVPIDVDLPEIQDLDPMRIIAAKLSACDGMTQFPIMVEDTSLHFDCLNGFPGPLIKWLLTSNGTAGIAKMVAALGVSGATARSVIGVALRPGEARFFEGTVRGAIVSPAGVETGWNSIFKPEGSKLTYGEMTADEWPQWSMRARAAAKVKDWLSSGIKAP